MSQPDIAIVTDLHQGTAMDMQMARAAAEALNAAYPGHLWAVSCDGKFLDIKNFFLSGNWGYKIRVDFRFSQSELVRKVIHDGGELLERYRLARGKFDQAAYLQLKTDRVGRLLADH